MALRFNGGLARHVSAGSYLQTLLVWAVSTVLLTRIYLALTGYPQIGGGSLHVAHVLWGGLLMLVAIVLLLATLGNAIRRAAAAIGGIGFGLFIDELGKFISRDVDYFFEPAVALIYLVFVALFLVFRVVERRTVTSETLLANAAHEVTEIILDGASEGEVARARDLLDRSGAAETVALGLRAAIAGAVAAPDRPPSALSRAHAATRRLYQRLLGWRGFQRMVVAVFVIQGIGGVAVATGALFGALTRGARLDPMALAGSGAGSPVVILASMVSLVLVIVGTFHLPRSRLAAYRWYERSLLVALFVTQVWLFWHSQLAATGVLAWNLLMLAGLATLIRQEVESRATREPRYARPRTS